MLYEIEGIEKFKMIHIVGNIDTDANTKVLDDEISQLIDQGHHHYVFNLERTTYLDSAGISIFIHCLCDVQENKGSVFIIAEDNQVRRVLEMVGIDRLIQTFDTQKQFMESMKVSV